MEISLKFVPEAPIGNKSSLVQVLAIPEPVMTKFTDADVSHQASLS